MQGKKKEIINGKLECSKCNLWFPATLKFFHNDKKQSTGFSSQCKECRNKGKREWNQQNKEKVSQYNKKHKYTPIQIRKKNLKQLYGITLEDYDNMFNNQYGKCKICKKHQSELKRILVVDHCHNTGKIRGLLCDDCNKGLGAFKHNPDFLTRAAKYINEN